MICKSAIYVYLSLVFIMLFFSGCSPLFVYYLSILEKKCKFVIMLLITFLVHQFYSPPSKLYCCYYLLRVLEILCYLI